MVTEVDGIVMHPDLDELVKLINTLPGIEVFEYEFSKNGRVGIMFKSTDRRGIFLLTKSLSKRYFMYSDNWAINVTTGDQFLNNYLPVYYRLFSLNDCNTSQVEIFGLVTSINKLMKDSGTLEAYNLGNLVR